MTTHHCIFICKSFPGESVKGLHHRNLCSIEANLGQILLFATLFLSIKKKMAQQGCLVELKHFAKQAFA